MRAIPLCLGSIYSLVVCFKAAASTLLCLADGKEEVKEQEVFGRQVIPFCLLLHDDYDKPLCRRLTPPTLSSNGSCFCIFVTWKHVWMNPTVKWALSDLFCIIFFLRGMLFLGYMLLSWLVDCQSKERRVGDISSRTGGLYCMFYKTEFW